MARATKMSTTTSAVKAQLMLLMLMAMAAPVIMKTSMSANVQSIEEMLPVCITPPSDMLCCVYVAITTPHASVERMPEQCRNSSSATTKLPWAKNATITSREVRGKRVGRES